MGYRDQGGSKCGNHMIVGVDANVQVVQDNVNWDFRKLILMVYDLNRS